MHFGQKKFKFYQIFPNFIKYDEFTYLQIFVFPSNFQTLVLANRPVDQSRPGPRRHAEPAPGALRPGRAPAGDVEEPNRRVLGRRAAGRGGQRERVGGPAGDHDPADVERRAQQHQAHRARGIPLHRLLRVILLPRLRPRQQQRLRRPQQLTSTPTAGPGAGPTRRGSGSTTTTSRTGSPPTRRGWSSAARWRCGRSRWTPRSCLAAGVGDGGGAVVRQPRRVWQEAVRGCDRPALRLAAPHGGQGHPARAHPAALVPHAPWNVQPGPVTTQQQAFIYPTILELYLSCLFILLS
jgi:hypothetical protein